MLPLAFAQYESIIDALLPAIIFLVLAVIVVVGSRFLFGASQTKEIIEAEKKRKECPSIQDGIFTRLYTMPYDESLTTENIRAYCEEHFPSYFCSASKHQVIISETKTGMSGEVRTLYITHLKEHNISAIDFKDPHEVEYTNRYQFNMRTSLHDKGFSKDIREIVHHFQQKAIAQASK